MKKTISPSSRLRTRRHFLADCGMGMTGLALSAMLAQDGVAKEESSLADGQPHFPPKVKSIIWLFMIGGTSHMESFDPKPELNVHAGKTFDESPYGEAVTGSQLPDDGEYRFHACDANSIRNNQHHC